MSNRNYQFRKRTYGDLPTWTDPVNLPAPKRLIQGAVLNGNIADYANKGSVLHVNSGNVATTFPTIGKDNCAVFAEVAFLIVYGGIINKTIDNWTDGTNGTVDDFGGFAAFLVSQVGCAVVSSSWNEGYVEAAPYAVDMSLKPVIAYKMQRAIALELNKYGWRYIGEYSGVCYPLSLNSTMSNSESFRNMILGTPDADRRCYNALRGQPEAGNPNLQWLGNPLFSTDLYTIMDALIDNYFEPSSMFNSADAYILAMTLSGLIVRGALRHLNNTTCRICYYGYAQHSQEYNTQFFEKPLPPDIGGKFVGTNWISWDLSLHMDASVIGFLIGDYQQWWIENTLLHGTNPRRIRNENGVYQHYEPSGPGSHNPDRGDAPYRFEANVEHGYIDTPRPGHDMPKEAANCFRKMFDLTGSLTPKWFPVRPLGATQWGKGTAESLIDAFQGKGAFAVGLEGNNSCAYELFSFADNKADFEVLCTGNVPVTQTVAPVTGVQGFHQN